VVNAIIDPINTNNAITNYNYYFGKNDIIGLDVSLAYNLHPFQSILNYTLSKNTQQFETIYRGQNVLSPNDRRHVISFTNQFNINNNLSIWSNISAMSGTPYFDVGFIPMFNKPKGDFRRKEIIDLTPDFLSVDGGINYNFKINQVKSTLRFYVTNITDHTNVKSIQQAAVIFDPKGQPIINRNQINQLGRFVNFSFGIQI
jgi:hypothetical protein